MMLSNIWKQLKNELAVECEIEVLGGGWRRKVEVLQKGCNGHGLKGRKPL